LNDRELLPSRIRVLLVGRDDWQMDEELNRLLLASLASQAVA
jgi:hypothetical protein